ncbi:MAG: hypothetical protein J6A63_00115 [Clostridia bacterium]|nr:hypothetical protein [Clostridia bacterium]
MKKRLIKLFSVVCALLLSLAFLTLGVSCQETEYELYGFSPKTEILVEKGAYVQAEKMHIFDSEDNYYDAKFKVVDSENKQVETSGNGFFAVDLGEYKIVYTVISVKDVYTKETVVKVSAAGTNYAIDVYVPETLREHEPCEIIIGNKDKELYEFTITATCDGVAEIVENQTFTPTKSGEYVVEVKAQSLEKKIVQTYTVNVLPALLEGVVETFDENWSNKRGAWKIATTEETGVKNRFGDDADYVSATTNEQWLKFYVTPTNEKKYYETLAEQGYEYVSVWVYLDSALPHLVQQFNGYSNYFAKAHNVMPKTWTEIKITLQDDPKYDFNGSFLNGFNYFMSGAQNLLTIDNSDQYNGANGGREKDAQGNYIPYTIYIDDIYAIKKGETIQLNADAETSVGLGESVDLTELVSSEDAKALTYIVEYRDESVLVEDGVYQFLSSGDYKIKVGYGAKTPNRYGSTTFDFTVISPYTANYTALIKEKSGASVDVSLSELNFALKNREGATVETISLAYTAKKNGVPATVMGKTLTAKTAGCYDITVEATFLLDGKTCTTFIDVPLDVWDAEHKYDIFAFDETSDYFADSYYMNKSWEKVPTTSLLNEYEGQTGKILKVAMPSQQRGFFTAKPTYSKNYYEQLLQNDESVLNFGTLFVTFSYRLEDKAGTSTRNAWVFNATTRSKVTCGQWYTVKLTLEDFINNYYDAMESGFAYLKSLRGGASVTISENKGYAFFALANNDQLNTDCYFTESDVFVQEFTGKYVDITQSDRIYSWDYNWQRLTYDKVFSVQTFTEDTAVGGKTGEMLVYDGTQQKAGFQYLPAYNKEYFEFILSRYANAYVSVYIYVDIAALADYTNVNIKALGNNAEYKHIRKWHEVKISLADIVANFEALQISTLKDSNRQNLISVENIHYTKAEENKNMQIYFSGFDFILGEETIIEQ